MFDWLQHLFTVRALERELTESRAENATLKLKVEQLQQVIAVKDEELGRVKHDFESFKQFHSSKPIKYPNLSVP